MAHSNRIDLTAKIRDYEQFANDVLKVDLQKTVEQRANFQQEIDELEELRRNVQQLQAQQEVSRPSNMPSLCTAASYERSRCCGVCACTETGTVVQVRKETPAPGMHCMSPFCPPPTCSRHVMQLAPEASHRRA
jgi:DNA repair exonuclease SbcCD ATPase subunit